MTNEITFGHFSIGLPDETNAFFTIFEDLAVFLGTKSQSEAVTILKKELDKNVLKPNIEFENEFTRINSKNPETIFIVAKTIINLTISKKRIQPSENELNDIYEQLKKYKKASKQKWEVGDILSIPMLNGTYAFGQIVGTHLTKRHPILALFELNTTKQDISIEEIKSATAISVFNSDELEICNHTYKVLFNYELLVKPERVNNENNSGGASLHNIANVYFCLEPWNVMADEDYYDEYLLPEIKRPKNIVWLNKEDRLKYRRDNFNIDENNNYISK